MEVAIDARNASRTPGVGSAAVLRSQGRAQGMRYELVVDVAGSCEDQREARYTGTLRVMHEASGRTDVFVGRVLGLEDRRRSTVLSVPSEQMRTVCRHVPEGVGHTDLLRIARWETGDHEVTAEVLPPAAALRIASLYTAARQLTIKHPDNPKPALGARAEAARVRQNYASTVPMALSFVAPALEITRRGAEPLPKTSLGMGGRIR